MKFAEGIQVWGDPVDQGALEQLKRCAETADYAGMMADHHKGYAVPIGGVLGYEDKISPSGVGYDIGCGNKAICTDVHWPDIHREIPQIMDTIWERISFGIGRHNETKVDHELFDDDDAWNIPAVGKLKQMARDQLGTVGSGNHFVDLFVDERLRIWVGVHFGSRGLGHKIATYFLNQAGAKDSMDAEPCLLDVDSPIGSDYLAAMHLAGRYAYAGRDWVCDEVARILGGKILEEVHNHHNFAWREYHYGKKLWVVRKGATPAFFGQRGFIGATMGEPSVIIEGTGGLPESLHSTVHGAGRVMSRTAARGKIHRKTGRVISEGCVSQEMMDDWVKESGIVLRGAGLDESPHCYKRLSEVLKHHEKGIKILHILKPVGVAMAGANEHDPYKD